MKTIPTVCATATIVGVSAVGYAIGRPEDPSSSRPNTQKRKHSSEPFPPSTRQSESFPRYSTALSVASTPRDSHPPRSSGRASSDLLRRSSRHGRRLTAPVDLMEIDEPSDSGFRHDIGPVDPDGTLRSKASWIKRLSSLSSTHSSPLASPTTGAPSLSFSNGSAVFSHSGSTAPIIGHRPSAPLPRNKLVKRSSSLRLLPNGEVQERPPSRRPTLRRPATSHQRSATLQMHSQLRGPSVDRTRDVQIPFAVAEAPADPSYRQYFTPKVAKDTALSKKRFAGDRGVRKIFPDDRYRPTLITAKSVVASSVEVDDTLSLADESEFGGSRPMTPLGFGFARPSYADSFDEPRPPRPSFVPGYRPSSAIEAPRDYPLPVSSRSDSPDAPSAEGRSSRSFSFGSLLVRGSSFRKSRGPSKHPVRHHLSRGDETRAVSAPLPSTQETSSSDPDSGRPMKKRDITDPTVFRRDIYTSSSHSASVHTDLRRHPASRPSSSQQWSPSAHAFTPDHSSPLPPHASVRDSTSGSPVSTDRSPFPLPLSTQPPSGSILRHSLSPSERASTLVGSDMSEQRGVTPADEEETDMASETVFDSIRTRGTRSTSGARGPSIDQIFDMPTGRPKSSQLKDALPKSLGPDLETDVIGPNRIMEETESVSTNDAMAIASDLAEGGSPTTLRVRSKLQPSPLHIPSSPPVAIKSLNLGSLEYDNFQDQDDESRWSMDESDNDDPNISMDDLTFEIVEHVATPLSIRRSSPLLIATGSSSNTAVINPTQRQPQQHEREKDSRSNLFNWSEQPSTDKSPGNRTPPRPQTVHGKKDTDSRGSRSIGRRAPSALHARSQSVPVVPDIVGKRDTVVMNKFGTWGVGSKGVTEDWDDDFDFSNTDEAGQDAAESEDRRVDSGMAVVVPQTIRDQQLNVLANIGLLKEWGIIIEELKQLKIRAAQLGILDGAAADVWNEVDAMIDLADQEAEGDTAPRATPPSSPGFDADGFDDDAGIATPAPGSAGRRGRRSTSARLDGPTSVLQSSPRNRRKSVLPPNGDIFSEPTGAPATPTGFGTPRTPSGPNASDRTTPTPVTTRPRKNSEAVARSVIEALQKRPSVASGPTAGPRDHKEKKVPFDTATLKHIVPYVNGLVRKVRSLLRDVEGLSNPSSGVYPTGVSGHMSRNNGVYRKDDDGTGFWDIADAVSGAEGCDAGYANGEVRSSPTKRAGSVTPSRIGSATGSPCSRRNRRSRVNNGGVVPEEGAPRSGAAVDELTGQMKMMTVM